MIYDEVIKVRVHAGSPDIWQEIYAYITYQYDKIDVEIKMPLWIKPDDIKTDIYAALAENWIPQSIDDLKYTLSPEIL